MKRDRRALVISLLLFGGWVSWLGWQAARAERPVIVAPAQLSVAQYDVECDLSGEMPPTEVDVKAVRWSANDERPAGRIRVVNLPQAHGYVGAGTYLLPLVRQGESYWVAGLPVDPAGWGLPNSEGVRIYPMTPAVVRQWERYRGISVGRRE